MIYIHKIIFEDKKSETLTFGFSCDIAEKLLVAHQCLNNITKQKKLHARHLLKNTNYSIYDICFMSGFNSYTHFLYTFKNLYGCTASEYRLSQKNK